MFRNVVVTGAYGFLGRYVARHFSAEGAYVIGIGHGGWAQSEWQSWGLDEWHAGDVSIKNLLLYARKPDLIVHCAGGGSVGFSVQQPLLDFERTVHTTSQVLEFMRLHAQEARLVYPSSAAVYGMAPDGPIGTETTPGPISPYGVHKLMAEEMCRMYGRAFGLRSAIVRFFSVYGQELRKQLLWDACGKIRSGAAIFGGGGGEMRDWLHAADAGSLIASIARRADAAVPLVNGGSGRGTPVSEIVSMIRNAMEAADSRITYTGETRTGDPASLIADNSEPVAWGWKPSVELKEGIEAYCKWFKNTV